MRFILEAFMKSDTGKAGEDTDEREVTALSPAISQMLSDVNLEAKQSEKRLLSSTETKGWRVGVLHLSTGPAAVSLWPWDGGGGASTDHRETTTQRDGKISRHAPETETHKDRDGHGKKERRRRREWWRRDSMGPNKRSSLDGDSDETTRRRK